MSARSEKNLSSQSGGEGGSYWLRAKNSNAPAL